MASEIVEESETTIGARMNQSPWKIRKILIEPDVALDRMFKFTKTEADHIFCNMGSDMVDKAKEGEDVRVKMVELDTQTEHELSFRKVRNGCVFGFKLGCITHFVVRRRLKVGDEVGIFVDQTCTKFYFSVLSRGNLAN
ncbi:hypothetical protein FNV43_RR13001 [Rhamnella rubrinervis]|uniref:Uncharacterized protein n=1 Tax=Rhamnella rubrinervis TaxID=2594499 RepID=A0A8K0H0B5_9ROSA|nr:hypothetical protein FNV43_RR13001 [Rhamnella rubrinervis]